MGMPFQGGMDSGVGRSEGVALGWVWRRPLAFGDGMWSGNLQVVGNALSWEMHGLTSRPPSRGEMRKLAKIPACALANAGALKNGRRLYS